MNYKLPLPFQVTNSRTPSQKVNLITDSSIQMNFPVIVKDK